MKGVSAGRRKLGKLLRTIRREREVSRNQLAERLEVPRSAISAYENECRLDPFEAKAVCKALGIDFYTFLLRWDSNQPIRWPSGDGTRRGVRLVDAGRYTNYSARRILNLLKATPRSIPRPVPASASDTSPLVIAVASADGPTPAWADTEA